MSASQRRYPVARNAPNRIVLGERHVLVLVGGTVDPTNFWEDINLPPDKKEQATHSRGYSSRDAAKTDPSYWATAEESTKDAHDKDWYWESNPDLRRAVGKLKAQFPNLHVFTMHGWSGDNAPRNREVAGAYLCDRLCGGGGENAYYVGWLKQPVSFHLMGHSHGGNVINEFTQRAASSGTWPSRWKIRSVTYLSTPFFPRLHPIETGAFHPDCAILNVFNRYDLTQRVVADFNLYQLNGVLHLADAHGVLRQIAAISFDGELLWALVPEGVQDMDPSWLGIDFRAVMDPSKGARLYRECLRCLDQLDAVFEEVHAIIGKLHGGVVFPLAIQFVDRMCAGREVVSAELAQRFHREIDRLRAGIGISRRALRARVATGTYPVSGFVDDLHLLDFVEPLITFLELDTATFRGPLADLLHDLLVEQIEVFDDTTHTPDDKLRGTPFASHLLDFDVTRHDLYAQGAAAKQRPHYEPLIARLEAIEQRYADTHSQKDLLDLLFTLAAQVPAVRSFVSEWLRTARWVERATQALEWQSALDNWFRGEAADHLVVTLHRLAGVVLQYAELLHERDVGELEVPQDRLPPKRTRDPTVGSLDHFMRISHSVSRDDLYPEVRDALLPQLSPRRK